MSSTLVAMLALAGLFACWGFLRPADRRPGGCHGCTRVDDPAGCGETCPLFEDLESQPKVGVER
jgi:hypothetical protein